MPFFEHRRDSHSMTHFYNKFYKLFGKLEKVIIPMLEGVLAEKVVPIKGRENKTVLEYACGSGALTLQLADLFKSVEGKDSSVMMLERAMNRSREAEKNIRFSKGDMLNITEADKSYDYVFVSFALHLIPIEDEINAMKKFLSIAREGVFIIDHSKVWNWKVAAMEWWEGSYYDQFIKYDFSAEAEKLGASGFEECEIGKCSVMAFNL